MPALNLPRREATANQPLKLNDQNIGRTVGILLLFQLATALTLPFILSKAITYGSSTFLTSPDVDVSQIRLSVFISFVGAAITVYLGILLFQVFRLYSKTVALLFMIVCAISCTLDLVQGGTILSMLAMRNQVLASGGGNSEVYQIVGTAVAAARRSAHIIQLLAIGAWIFIFYASLFRFRLIPRVIAGIGLVGIILQFTGVTAMMFLGNKSIGEMAMPLLPIQIFVALWLMVKGFQAMSKMPADGSNIGL